MSRPEVGIICNYSTQANTIKLQNFLVDITFLPQKHFDFYLETDIREWLI